ncbi:hypothetical protein NDU88_004605 [Pleurodeles waltl]|uniref:Uncharacterized protein n=1 Tax=Pleurodeles waltl TaxID=8319 RepID=A0AAV7W5Q9_PLEWA|nr:hypothetical protein NDU88_004605 [Pleurodeles waltl]
MDQYTAQGFECESTKRSPKPLGEGCGTHQTQILAAIESSRHAMQTQIAAIAVDVNLLRTDLRVVAERLVATEKQVTCLQSEMDRLKASLAILEAKMQKLEARVEDAEGIPILWAGDFNCVLDGVLDRDPLKMGTKPHMTDKLRNAMRNLHFVDV